MIIYHRNPLLCWVDVNFEASHEELCERLDWPHFYTPVAEIEANTLCQVYELTQHLDVPWHLKKCVKVLHQQAPRSTSVGDAIIARVRGDDGERMVVFVVAPLGFRLIEEKVMSPKISPSSSE